MIKVANLEELRNRNTGVRLTEADLDADSYDIDDAPTREIARSMRAVRAATKKHDDLEAERVSFGNREEQRISKHMKNKKFQNWDKVNMRNYNKNREMDFNKFKEIAEKTEKAKGQAREYNPFARRPKQQKILWDVGGATTTDTFIESDEPVGVARGAGGGAASGNNNDDDMDVEGRLSPNSAEALALEAVAREEESELARTKKTETKKTSVSRTGMSMKEYLAAKKAGETFQ